MKNLYRTFTFLILLLLVAAKGAGQTVVQITSLSQITNAAGNYKLMNDVSDVPGVANFSGTLDGDMHHITGVLSRPLFTTLSGKVHDLIIDSAAISLTGNPVGAIACIAEDNARVYNCGLNGGTVQAPSGDKAVGSLVGRLNGSARVINCYSYARVISAEGTGWVAGIVGNNSVTSTAASLTTMVMNCMFYGTLQSGNDKYYPIYGGTNISNTGANGLNNYNYFRHQDESFNNHYNGALEAEDRFLTRFEFYRGILNSNKRLCSFYIFGDQTHTADIAKWVCDPGDALPFPVLKKQGFYYSSTNRRAYREDSPAKIGSLTVNVAGGNTLTLPITDMDSLSGDFVYGKVQLPYCSEAGLTNYGTSGVLAGWTITSTTGGSEGNFNTTDITSDYYYNFADRTSAKKDKDRVFAQGGFYIVPEGVTVITISPRWATNVVYLAGEYLDKVDYGTQNFTLAGKTDIGTRTVVHTLDEAKNAINGFTGTTVYDNAIVLVGNTIAYCDKGGEETNGTPLTPWGQFTKPFTIMSIDEDNDREPDYCLMHYHIERRMIGSVRFDFLYHPGIGRAMKPTDTNHKNNLNQGIWRPKGWFEITETCVARYTEFECDYSGGNAAQPVILNGGVFEDFVTWYKTAGAGNLYVILGGRSWLKSFSYGCHLDNDADTKRTVINVLGGEYADFHLTGQKDRAETQSKDAHCYAVGGYMHEFSSANMEGLNGNVKLRFDHTLFDRFYGGGKNETHPVMGNIHTWMKHCEVKDIYCGGPEFGNMQSGKTVETVAEDCTFRNFFGAGNGGNALKLVQSHYQQGDYYGGGSQNSESTWYTTDFSNVRLKQNNDKAFLVQYDMPYFAWAGGGNQVSRFYQYWASLSTATTHDVTTTLTRCHIKGDFYGGGNLGHVEGNLQSTLIDCIVDGNVYGAGYSASVPKVEVYSARPAPTLPSYDRYTGQFTPMQRNDTSLWFDWTTNATDVNAQKLQTTVNMADLGVVTGDIHLTLKGNTRVAGSVYGGGNESKVTGTVHVQIGEQPTTVTP